MAFFSVAVALALAGGEAPLTLEQALDLAQRRNPELLAGRERAAGQAARAESVRRSSWPRISLSSGWSRTDNPSMVFAGRLNAGELAEADLAIDRLNDPGGISHLTTAAALEVPLDVFGKIGAQTEAQRAAARMAEAELAEASLLLRQHVVEAYRRAALAGRATEVTAHALAGARAREADVAARVAEGAALQAELLRARVRRRLREADLAERRAESSIALAGLARLIGAESGTAYLPSEAAPAPDVLAGDEASWSERALRARPLLAAARERLEAERWAARGERRSLLPDLSAFGQLQDDRNSLSGGARSTSFGAFVRWTAFDASRGKRRAAAEAAVRAAEHELRAANDQVRLEVASAWRRALAARERYAAAAGGAEEGREALRVVQERRRAGIATLTDELETEAGSLAAELEEIRAAAEAAIGDAALERATGGTGRERQ